MSTIHLTPDVLAMQQRAVERGQIAASPEPVAKPDGRVGKGKYRKPVNQQLCAKCGIPFLPSHSRNKRCPDCWISKNKREPDRRETRLYNIPHASGVVLGPAPPAVEDCPSRAGYVDELWARLKAGKARQEQPKVQAWVDHLTK